MDGMAAVLVNRLFDVEYLHRIRRTHRSIFLRILRVENDQRNLREYFYAIKVNERVIKTTEAEKYFKFLTETVGVRVESFRVKEEREFYGMRPMKSIIFHKVLIEKLLKNQRLKVLTGMEDMCPKGCSECVRHARTCEEYGPLQMNVYLDSYQQPRHYKKLIVSEALLHELANQAVYLAKTRKDCLDFVKIHRKPNISCNEFCLSISEFCFRHRSWPDKQGGLLNEVYPREIIEEMCQSWKPNSIRVVFGGKRYAFASRSDWRFKNFFTAFTFKRQLPDYQKKHRMEFESLEIDIQDAQKPCYHLYRENLAGAYNHLIANFRNLFPSKAVTVKTFRYPSTTPLPKETFDETIFRNILKTVWENNPEKHWKLTLNHMLPVPSVDFRIPESFTFMDRQISCVALPSFLAEIEYYDFMIKDSRFTQYTVKPYCITDEENDRVLNFELFFEIETTPKSFFNFLPSLLGF